jgi:hypothetical protein
MVTFRSVKGRKVTEIHRDSEVTFVLEWRTSFKVQHTLLHICNTPACESNRICRIGLILSVHLGTCLLHNRKLIYFLLWSIYLMSGNHCTSAVRSFSRVYSIIDIFSHRRRVSWKQHKSKIHTHKYFKSLNSLFSIFKNFNLPT